MAILALIVGLLCNVSLVLIARQGTRRGADACTMLAAGAFSAALGLAVVTLAGYRTDELRPFLHAEHLGTAAFTGVTGALGTLFYFLALRGGPTGPVATLTALQLLVPILLSVLLWHDRLTAGQGVGAVLAGAAMLLVQATPSQTHDGARGPWKVYTFVGLVLLGLANASFKFKQVHFGDMPDTLYLFFYMVFCGTILGGYLAARRQRPTRASLALGGAMGLGIIGLNLATLWCLKVLPATVVYLTLIGGSPVVLVLISIAFLGERYPRRVQVALLAGIVGICLMVAAGPGPAAPATEPATGH